MKKRKNKDEQYDLYAALEFIERDGKSANDRFDVVLDGRTVAVLYIPRGEPLIPKAVVFRKQTGFVDYTVW